MRTVACAPLGRSVSAIGFGCASLGSRVSAADGRRALALALDQGVTWFDTAPPYGDGASERLLGAALEGRRHEVVICTKVGIARPSGGGLKSLARAVLQPVIKAAPALRPLIAGMRPPPVRPTLSASVITASLEGSLRELGTDYVDVLALHEPSMAEAGNHEILSALEAAVASGKARALSVAGDLGVSTEAFAHSRAFQMAQVPLSPLDAQIATVRTALRDAFLLTHGILGSGALGRFSSLLQEIPDSIAQVQSMGYTPPSAAADILLDLAFADNENGVVLMSMFNPDNIRRNTRRAAQPVDHDTIGRLRAVLGLQGAQEQ